MKTTTKILSAVLVAVFAISAIMLTGCQKPKEPATLLIDALGMYRDAVQNNAVVKVVQHAANNGAVGLAVTSGTGEEAVKVDLTAYMNATENNVGLVMNADSAGKKVDVQMLLTPQKLVAGTSLLKDAYGLDLEKAQANFPKSLFGTQGANMLNITAEDEQEILKALQELADAMKQEAKTVDLYQIFTDALQANATFTADSKEPITVQDTQVKGTTVTATLTKGNVKALVNEIVTKAELTDAVNEILKSVNDFARVPVDYTSIDAEDAPKKYNSLNDVIDEALKDKKDEDTVLTLKAALDAKHDAIVRLDVTADNETVTIELGADPTNITRVVISYPTEKQTQEAAAKKERAIVTIDIQDGATSATYTILNEKKDGLIIDINKAHKRVTFTAVEEGTADTEDAYVFTYELTDKTFAVTFEDEGNDIEPPSTMTFKFNADATSPVKYDNYKDILTMTEEDLQALMTELAPYLPPTPENPELPNIDDPEIPSLDVSSNAFVDFDTSSDKYQTPESE